MTALLSVILNIVSFEITTQINCQVSFVSHILLVLISGQLYSQGLGHFFIRKCLLLCARLQRPIPHLIYF